MPRNESAQFRSLNPLAVAGLALMLAVLAPALYAPTAFAKDNPEDFTRIYTHTYDEVFQASQEAIERMGLFVTDKDKDKGKISGNGVYRGTTGGGAPHNIKMTFDIHIETVSAKPETQVAVNAKGHGSWGGGYAKQFAQNFLSELQKVLATYK